MIDPRTRPFHRRLSWNLTRALDAARKVATGFPLHGECVWPGRETDLFLAHRAIYDFFAGSVSGKRVLDAGSGAGYGSRILRQAGAARVLGIDLDPRHVRYATRHFAMKGVMFEVGDCERLQLEPGSLDLVVSSNVLEHLSNPAAFLTAARDALVEGGEMLLAVPWIIDEASRAHSGSNEFHRSNLTAAEWRALFDAKGWDARQFVQVFDPGSGTPDFFDPRQTPRSAADFPFVEVELAGVDRPYSLTLLFRLRRAR